MCRAWTAMVFSLELMMWTRNSPSTLFCLRSPHLAPNTLSKCQIRLLWLNMASPALDLHNCSILVWIRKPDDLWGRAGGWRGGCMVNMEESLWNVRRSARSSALCDSSRQSPDYSYNLRLWPEFSVANYTRARWECSPDGEPKYRCLWPLW